MSTQTRRRVIGATTAAAILVSGIALAAPASAKGA